MVWPRSPRRMFISFSKVFDGIVDHTLIHIGHYLEIIVSFGRFECYFHAVRQWCLVSYHFEHRLQWHVSIWNHSGCMRTQNTRMQIISNRMRHFAPMRSRTVIEERVAIKWTHNDMRQDYIYHVQCELHFVSVIIQMCRIDAHFTAKTKRIWQVCILIKWTVCYLKRKGKRVRQRKTGMCKLTV